MELSFIPILSIQLIYHQYQVIRLQYGIVLISKALYFKI